jgi:Oxidoreductase family, C-terminal alpha/beta domain
MDPAYEMDEDLKAEITVDGQVRKKTFKKRDQFAPELVHFSDCILKNKQPAPSGREGLADIRIIEALLQSAKINRPVSVRRVDIQRRASLHQETSKPAVHTPAELVNAVSPGEGD